MLLETAPPDHVMPNRLKSTTSIVETEQEHFYAFDVSEGNE